MTFYSIRGVGRCLAASATLVFMSTSLAARAQEVTVGIDNFTFTPPGLTVKVGATVSWANHDDIPHTIVSAGKFKSKTLDTDNTFSFTFTSAGEYKYFCSLHPHMTGMIKVE